MHRRRFLGQLAAAASLPLAANLRAFSAPAAPKIPQQIKAFNIDFNWYMPGEGDAQEFAPPGHFAQANPEYQIGWYHDMGVNVIHTFAVSCDGYAWYRNGFVPAEPGLKYDFLPEMVRLGHKKDMMIMGYFCVGGNSKWGKDHPDLSYGTPSDYHIPFTDVYLDYLTRSMEDALRKTGIDGFMIDWVWNPNPKLRASGWIPAEQKLFTQLTGKPFPASGKPDDESMLDYEQKAIERCLGRIIEARNRVDPRRIIWLSCNNFADPALAGSKMLKQIDWSINESPDPKLFLKGKEMLGPQARMIQNLVGWAEHDAAKFLSVPANRELDLYGFAMARPDAKMPPVEYYLTRPLACFTGTDRYSSNDRNIAALARFYRGLPFNAGKAEDCEKESTKKER